ncbi:hypothetical protein DPMN_104239 [Dreissena polymorpha]|uniref:Uncharacterized protein n=1 Tax=Dreissena polymorpha TaxID=45954 RepID=A0A9D4H9K0_DREPO|nr:hypothetical protein DPMN_104239 [Dreissena polymorpha]
MRYQHHHIPDIVCSTCLGGYSRFSADDSPGTGSCFTLLPVSTDGENPWHRRTYVRCGEYGFKVHGDRPRRYACILF